MSTTRDPSTTVLPAPPGTYAVVVEVNDTPQPLVDFYVVAGWQLAAGRWRELALGADGLERLDRNVPRWRVVVDPTADELAEAVRSLLIEELRAAIDHAHDVGAQYVVDGLAARGWRPVIDHLGEWRCRGERGEVAAAVAERLASFVRGDVEVMYEPAAARLLSSSSSSAARRTG